MKQFAQLEQNSADNVASSFAKKEALPAQVQHARTDSIPRDIQVSNPEDKNEQQADHVANQVTSLSKSALPKLNINPLTAQTTQPGSTSYGTPLSASLKDYFEPRFGHSFSNVRLHDGEQAAEMNDKLNARAFTVGQDIYFGDSADHTNSEEGRKLLAHELTHILQNRDNPDNPIQRDKVSSLKKSIRTGLRISRIVPDASHIASSVKKFFDPKEGTSESSGIPVEVDPVITDKQVIKGFKSLASDLVNNSRSSVNPADNRKPLGQNSILDVDVDPSAFGGVHAIYRFIRYTDGKDEKLYVEKRGTSAAAQSDAPVKAPTPQPKPPSTVKEADKSPDDRTFLQGSVPVDTITVKIDDDFEKDEARTIIAAVQLLPAATRSKIDGLEFVHSNKAKGAEGEAGKYDPEEDEITLYSSLFSSSSRKVGVQSTATYRIIHEIGHAIDLRPEFKAEQETNKAKEEKAKLQKVADKITVGDTNDPLAGLVGDPKPDPVKEKAKLDIAKLDKKIASLSKKLGTGKSLSGNELDKNTESLKTAFGKALEKDGIKAVKNAKKTNAAAPNSPAIDTLSGNVSLYGNKNLMEAFAENFTTYMLDPDLLKSIRPNTYKYFAKYYPRPKKQGAKP